MAPLIEASGKISALLNLICWRKVPLSPAGFKPNLAKRSARYGISWSCVRERQPYRHQVGPYPRPSNSFELSLVVISRMLSSLIRPVAFRSASVSVFAGLLAVATPPCHANAVAESKVTMGSMARSVESSAGNNPRLWRVLRLVEFI
jgi:hypothetical protein